MELTRWFALILSLPTQKAAARMRVWRALKAAGCGTLRDGVYVLPAGTSAEEALLKVAEIVIGVRGTAHVVELVSRSESQTMQIRALFDRSQDYAALVKTIHQAIRRSGTPSPALLRRTLQQIRRKFAVLRAIDFFPGAARDQTEAALADLDMMVQQRVSPDEPQAAQRALQRLDKREYQHCTWATRRRPWVDRLASAWLICRFIDPHARFVWLDHPKHCPATAIGFDFDGAAFTHVGQRVTFEVLLASFALENDPALRRIGNLVHLLDIGGIPVPEAKGIEAILRGAKEQFADDHRFLVHACSVFDSLYQTYRKEDTAP